MSYTNCKRCGDELVVFPGTPRPLCARCARAQAQNAQVPGLSPLQMLHEQVRALLDLSEPYSASESVVDTGDLEELYETVRRLAEKENHK